MKRTDRSSRIRSEAAALRAGTVLLIVLVVVALLALGAYTFAEIMSVEAQATTTYGREVQARALADSGVELASTLLSKRYLPNSKSYYNDPQMFEGVLLRDATSAKGRGRFSVVTGNEADTSGRTVRFGLSDESSKLNLNTLMRMMGGGSSSSSSSSSNSTTTSSAGGTSGSGGGSGGGGGSSGGGSGGALKASDVEAMLMVFPEMTSEIAEAIIDWMDSDTTPMTSGAENEYYQGLVPAYTAKNGPIDSLDELLLVKGVTPQLLFGEDTNHNGILDPNENDGAATLPLDNADGILQRGWSAYWTVYSRETNLRSDGTPRINVNQSDLSNLFTEVSEAFDAKTATFILQYRVNGPATTGGGQGGNSSSGGNNSMASTSGGNSSGGNSSGGNSGAGGNSSSGKSSSSNSSSTSKSSGSSGSQQSSQTSSGASQSSGSSSKSTSSGSGGGGTVQRGGSVTANIVGGIDISGGASYTIKSLYELPGARAQQGKGAATATTSPWPSTPADLTQNLPLIMDKLSLTDDPYIAGRININTAPREVLMVLAGLQGMSETIVDSIYGAQGMRFSGSSGGDVAPDRMYAGWLFTDGLVSSINILETLDPYITGRGDVFHVQSVGYFEGGGPMARVEAIIDATVDPPQVIFLRDLTELGRGFSASLLSTGR